MTLLFVSVKSRNNHFSSYHMAYACERNFLDIHCGSNRIIGIMHATYGRQTLNQCAEGNIATTAWDLDCAAPQRRISKTVAERYILRIRIHLHEQSQFRHFTS